MQQDKGAGVSPQLKRESDFVKTVRINNMNFPKKIMTKFISDFALKFEIQYCFRIIII
jgi:hypothetical protein